MQLEILRVSFLLFFVETASSLVVFCVVRRLAALNKCSIVSGLERRRALVIRLLSGVIPKSA